MLKLEELYRLAIEAGIKADQRPRAEIERLLKDEQEGFDKLSDKEKKRFDKDRLVNPFADSRILFGDLATEIESALVGIDIGPAEVLLADRLRAGGSSVDLVLAHHPSGRALAALADVMNLSTDLWAEKGMPIGQAESVFAGRIKEVQTSVTASNHCRTVDAARLLGFPFMCIHTPADNSVAKFLTDKIAETKPYLLGDVIDLLFEIDEYKGYAAEAVGPRIVVGSKKSRTGDVFVDMTGGTSGPDGLYKLIARSTQISTIVCMGISPSHKKEIEKHNLNCILAPHMPSDTLGLNLILDSFESRGGLSVVECSGFRRVNRAR
ncbi:MAG: NGG1p interacting factor NIF3 [Candidatus Coatesbacteria bacterium]|nr:NGG1p interacting factor NIF3 [Candidatus Coatesbacteria bacterium]